MKRMLFNAGQHSTSTSIGLLLLRLGAGGIMFAGHGLDKLLNFSEKADVFPDPLGIGSELSLASAVGTEVFCALLLVVGLATRWVSLPLLFTMCVAAFVVHADDPFKIKELAILYAIPYAALLLTGAGRYSIDASISNGRR